MMWVILVLGLLALGVWSDNAWFYAAGIFAGTFGFVFYVTILSVAAVAKEAVKKENYRRTK